MRPFRSALVALTAVLAFGLSGCGHGKSDTDATASPAAESSPAAQASTAADAAASQPPGAAPSMPSGSGVPTPAPNGTPIPAPSPTPDPNLLSVANGTILRSYSPAAVDGANDGNLRDAAESLGSEMPASVKPPYVFTFELAGPATITQFQASMRNASDDKAPKPSVTFAVSTTGPDSGFKDAATIALGGQPVDVNVKARWVRVTANEFWNSLGATGTIAPPATALKPTGIYVEQNDPDKNGQFVATGAKDGLYRVRFVMVGSSLVGTECTRDGIRGTFIGHLDGRRYAANFPGNKDANAFTFYGAVNEDGSIIAGTGGTYFTRTTEQPAFCFARPLGNGTHKVLVLDQDPIEPYYPTDAQPPVGAYRFEAIGAGMLDGDALAGKESIVARNTCTMMGLISQEQRDLLLRWVEAGHKLIVGGGAACNPSDYMWLPYGMKTDKGPETNNASLIQVENSALGTNDKNDAAHFIDATKYATDANTALTAAAVVSWADPHWCGHFFNAKGSNVNGFVQTYAVDGKGLIVYDGFDDDGNPQLQKIRLLELGIPVGADLPCTQHADDSFVLEPNQEATFQAGKAQTISAPLRILANQGWSGPVKMKATGDFPATISPNGFNLAGGTLNIAAAIHVPAAAKAGIYNVTVIADNGGGKTAQATITLTGTAPLVKQITKTQKRIRIYGIHFDVDSAVIQPRSEPVIAEIAQLLTSTPGLRFQVEGHTDSDGGAAYNLGLSQRRAQAVVDDLVRRYGIARSRLVAKGFGLTQPVASNATAAGKALNRRVELLRL